MIRLVRPSDAEAIQAIYAPHCAVGYASFEEAAPTVEEMRERIEVTGSRFAWLVCEIDGVVAGYAYAAPFQERASYRWAVAVSIYLAEGYRRTGMGRALYTGLLELLRLQGYRSAYAGIALPNAGSVGLHESLGFAQAASFPAAGFKLGAWRDVGWWHLELLPHEGTPSEPLATAAASQLPGWDAAITAGEALLNSAALSRRDSSERP